MRNRQLILKITVCAILAALSFVIDYVCNNFIFGLIKYSIYAFPIILASILFGVRYGVLTGLVEGVLIQLTWGLSPTTIFWILPPISWGLFSGIVNNLMRKTPRIMRILVIVIVCSLFANILNSVAYVADYYLIANSSWQTYDGSGFAFFIFRISNALIVWLVTIPIYTGILYLIDLRKNSILPSSLKDENDSCDIKENDV